jgi:hypothetical protein
MNIFAKSFNIVCLTSLIATAAFAEQTNNLGIFEGATDIGTVAKKGSVTFDRPSGEYRVTGGGANMWGGHDDCFFLWRKLTGDAVLTATVRFEGSGTEPHRKAALMIRKTLDADSPQVNATVHGNGLSALQFREATNDVTRSVSFPVNAPTRIRIERRGNTFTFSSAAKAGEPLTESGSIQVPLGPGPVYAGLAVCPHDAKGELTITFSDVTLEIPAKTAAPRGKN